VGALLAAYELKRAGIDIAIAHVETHGYTLSGSADINSLANESKLYGLWLSGDCYA
jgi:K+-sensing histidine kinase KdpD